MATNTPEKAFLLNAAHAVVGDLEVAARERRRGSAPPVPGAVKMAQLLRSAISDIQKEPEPCFSRSPIVSNLQSALDSIPSIAGAPRTSPRRRRGRRLFEQFSKTDLRWASCKFAEGVTFFRDKHPFVPPAAKAVKISDTARIVIFGDWGSGLPGAIKVGMVARAKLAEAAKAGREAHALHLGDVYYSGWAHEYHSRFLKYWPVLEDEADKFGSWCVNANHDMFSGGYAYYDTLLADRRFKRQAGSSEFVLLNQNWRFVALDTAWEENTVLAPRADWALNHLADETRGRVLLSHHYYFSVFEKDPLKVPSKFRKALLRRPVEAWLWGHEHRGAVYAPAAGVEHGRCIGHGGVPEKVSKNRTPPKGCLREFNQKSNASGGPWKKFGLAVVDCHVDRLEVGYFDEDGKSEFTEKIMRPVAAKRSLA